MASRIYINLLVSLLFFFLAMHTESRIDLPFRKIHITIANELDGDKNLLLHCWSRDDDLGTHNLPIHASYGFHFRTDFFYLTWFNCQFNWLNDSNQIVHYVMGLYYEGRNKCTNCSWVVKSSGPCMHNFDAHNLKCYRWRE